MRLGRFEILFDYAAKTNSRFVAPRIVIDELEANYRRHLTDRFNKLIRARDQLNGILLDPAIPRLELDVTASVDSYMRYVLQKLNVSQENVVDYKEGYLHDVLERAIHRRRPCTDRGEEIRDAVLWQTVLDVAEENGENVVFISKNTDQFTSDRSNLHPELAGEVAKRNVIVEYIPSLEEFGQRHATPIEFITKEWIESQIDSDLLFDHVFERAVETASDMAYSRASADEEIEGGYHNDGGGVEIDEFFVYAMQTGKYRIEARWYGRSNIEYEVTVNESLWSDRGSRRTRLRTAEVLLHVTVEAFVADGKISEWNIIEAYAEPD